MTRAKAPANGHRQTDLIGLFLSVIMASSAASLMAATDAPSLGIAFWRNALAAIILLPFLFKNIPLLRSLNKKMWIGMGAAGVFLGIHFAFWVPSVKLTSISAAISIVSTQVVWVALFAWLTGNRPPRRQAIGIILALLGVVVLTGIDLTLTPAAIIGDLFCVIAAIVGAAYMHNGQQVRAKLSLTAYTSVVYLIAALVLLVICLSQGVALGGYSPHAWLLIAAVTLFAQFGGHSLLNRALRSYSATTVSIGGLFQIPGGILIGWAFFGQAPKLELIPSILLIAAGTVLVLRTDKSNQVLLEVD